MTETRLGGKNKRMGSQSRGTAEKTREKVVRIEKTPVQ